MNRTASLSRETGETRIEVTIDLDGTGAADVASSIGFLDHMLTSLARHSRIDLTLRAQGDLHVDDHHTAEDCAILIGRALLQALGEHKGIARFGDACVPLDEALARAAIDLSGRPWPQVDLGLKRMMIGELASENITHFFNTLAIEARMALHVDVLRGSNDHHRAEAAFKALALALRQAVARDGSDAVPSTKGVI